MNLVSVLHLTSVLGLLIAGLHPAMSETVEEKVRVCATCHGKDGVPLNPDTPIIWGQNEGYIYIQLKDFKSGLRVSAQMNPIVSEISKDDMKAIAAYFSKKSWPRTAYQSSDSDVKAGQRIASAGLCTECHLSGFVGTSVIPRTSGQTVTYLEKTLLAFKSRARANNPDKAVLLGTFPEDDLKSMARYLAGIHVQQ